MPRAACKRNFRAWGATVPLSRRSLATWASTGAFASVVSLKEPSLVSQRGQPLPGESQDADSAFDCATVVASSVIGLRSSNSIFAPVPSSGSTSSTCSKR